MMLPISLLAAKTPVAPLYRVRHSVAVPLASDTVLADARSDGSAVGLGSGRMVNSVQTSAIYVLRGRRHDPDPARMTEGGDEAPRWNPVALLGGDRVAVARFDAPGACPTLYAATIGRRFTVARTALAPRPAPALHLEFGAAGAPRAFPAAWRTARLRPGGAPRPLWVRTARLPSGLEIGLARVDTGPGDAFPSRAEVFAVLRRGGVDSPLRDLVAGRPDLGAPLWVSPQGWIVAAAYRGAQSRLVWLEPIRRQSPPPDGPPRGGYGTGARDEARFRPPHVPAARPPARSAGGFPIEGSSLTGSPQRGHSILSADSVLAALALRFGAEFAPGRWTARLWHVGTNDVYELRSGSERLFLRVAPLGWRTASDVRWELGLLRHVAEAGVRVTSPVREAFTVASPESERHAALFTEAVGVPFHPPSEGESSPERARGLGRALARFHIATEGFVGPDHRFPLDRGHLVDGPLTVIEAWPGRAPEAARYRRIAERVGPTIASPTIARGPLHGDLNGDNAHEVGGAWTLFDFDCGGVGVWVYDLAVFRWAADRFGWSTGVWTAFRDGYAALRPLAEEEEASIPAFVLARELWLVGMHLASTDRWGAARYGDRYWAKAMTTLDRLEAECAPL